MTFYGEVNSLLRADCYRPWVPAKRRPPGSPKDQPKPLKRTLDSEFPKRLKQAMGEHDGGRGIGVPELARKVKCTRATLLNYTKGVSKTVEPLLLLEIADALGVRLSWLLSGRPPMRDVVERPFSPEAHEIATNIDSIHDPRLRAAAIRAARVVTTEPVADEKVEKAYKTNERPRIRGEISRPTLFNDDLSGPRET